MGMMTWSSGNPNAKNKSPLPGALNVKVVFTTLPPAPLLEGLRLSAFEPPERNTLRPLENASCITVYVV
jgi:hypothetical protein